MAKRIARFEFNHSYDIPTLCGRAVWFADGCEGTLSRIDDRFCGVRSLPAAAHDHKFEYAWSTVAWEYIDKGRRFPIR